MQSNFENNLFNLITILTNGQTTKQDIKGKQRQSYIYCGLEFLYNKFNVTKEQSYYSDPIWIQFFIFVRNSIVHNDSKINKAIINHKNFNIYKDLFIIKGDAFRFNDIIIIHHLLKTSRTYFNSFAHFIK